MDLREVLGLLLWALSHKKGAIHMSRLFECTVGVGLFIIIGTAGSTDLNAISLTQTILYSLIGLIVTSIGMVGCKVNKKKGDNCD